MSIDEIVNLNVAQQQQVPVVCNSISCMHSMIALGHKRFENRTPLGDRSPIMNADREILIFPVQLTTSRIGNLTRLIHTLAVCLTTHTYNVALTFIVLVFTTY